MDGQLPCSSAKGLLALKERLRMDLSGGRQFQNSLHAIRRLERNTRLERRSLVSAIELVLIFTS